MKRASGEPGDVRAAHPTAVEEDPAAPDRAAVGMDGLRKELERLLADTGTEREEEPRPEREERGGRGLELLRQRVAAPRALVDECSRSRSFLERIGFKPTAGRR